MTQEQIVEGNKLIAEFMGAKDMSYYYLPQHAEWRRDLETGDMDIHDIFSETELKYHYSWSWLMPVVAKITTGEELIGNEYRESIMDIIPYGDIEDSFNVVVEFIKWYNQQKGGTMKT
jgi:hypothetical protein